MISEIQIREQLARYLSGDQDYREFENWIIGEMSECFLDSPQEVRDLVGDIRLSMYELIEGHVDEAELKKELLRFVVGVEPPLVVDGDSNLPYRVSFPDGSMHPFFAPPQSPNSDEALEEIRRFAGEDWRRLTERQLQSARG
jgi:hypothetical protein